MTQGFYTNNGKWLNREQIPHVLESSKLIYADSPGMIEMIYGIWDWMNYQLYEFETLNDYLDSLQLEICMDENNPQEYLLLKRK